MLHKNLTYMNRHACSKQRYVAEDKKFLHSY